jgi:hypothetical protein
VRPNGTFTAWLLTATAPAEGIPPTGFAGRWLIADTLLVTVITLARE